MGRANAYFYAKIGFYRQIYHLRKKIFARRGLFVHHMVKKKLPCAVSFRVAPVSVGKDKNREKPLAPDAKCLLRAMDAVAV